MNSSEHTLPEIASEAIAVIDLVSSTANSVLYGWNALGRGIMRELRALAAQAGRERGLCCMKSTGDGYLLSFRDTSAADLAAVHAIEAAFELLRLLAERNSQVPEERVIKLRLAVHFGEVDVVENDREGPTVSFTFRLEGISGASLAEALDPMPPEEFPLFDYVLCSEHVAGILERRAPQWTTRRIGTLKLKGFSGLHDIFVVSRRPV